MITSDSPVSQDCLNAIAISNDLGFYLGLIVGVASYLAYQIIYSYISPYLWDKIHALKSERGIECHCSECEERPRRGIDL